MLNKFEAFNLAKDLHQRCKYLKLHKFHSDQLFRASSSVALNIAEGSGKRTPEDQRRYYANAFGSLRECQAVIELEDIKDPKIIELINRLGAILFKLGIRKQTPNTIR